MALDELKLFQEVVHENAKDHGWWDDAENFATHIALMHSELSEALEADRHGNPMSEKIPEFSHIEEELADVMIRILDSAEGRKLDVIGAMVAKHKYNVGRAHKHGGKKY